MLKKILKIGAFTAIAALGITALIRSNLFPKLKEKLHDYDVDFEKKKLHKETFAGYCRCDAKTD